MFALERAVVPLEMALVRLETVVRLERALLPSLRFFPEPWLALQLWILASNVPIKSPYFFHVFINIPARYHKHTQATHLSIVIQITAPYRHSTLTANMLKPLLQEDPLTSVPLCPISHDNL